MMAFSVPVTLASSSRMSCPTNSVARTLNSPLICTCAPSLLNARKCVSTRRRPITSPPGGGSSTCFKPRQHGAGQQDRRANVAAQIGIELRRADIGRLKLEGVPIEFGDLYAQLGQQLQHGMHVANARDVVQDDGLIGEEGGRQQGQGGVLVAAGGDSPGQGPTTANDELIHKVDFFSGR